MILFERPIVDFRPRLSSRSWALSWCRLWAAAFALRPAKVIFYCWHWVQHNRTDHQMLISRNSEVVLWEPLGAANEKLAWAWWATAFLDWFHWAIAVNLWPSNPANPAFQEDCNHLSSIPTTPPSPTNELSLAHSLRDRQWRGFVYLLYLHCCCCCCC
jgi:hypothetical protein